MKYNGGMKKGEGGEEEWLKIQIQSLFIRFERLQCFLNVTNSEKIFPFEIKNVTVICRHSQ